MPPGRKPNKIKQILSQIADAEAFLKATAGHSDIRTMAGMQTKQREMMTTLDTLQQEYKDNLKQNSIALCLVGDSEKQKEFAAIAEQYECTVLDANVLYRNIASALWPHVRPNDLFTSDYGRLIGSWLRPVAIALGFRMIAHPMVDASMVVPIDTIEHFTHLIRQAVEVDKQAYLNCRYLEAQALNQAFLKRYAGSSLLLVLTGSASNQLNFFKTHLLQNPELTKEHQSNKIISIAMSNDVKGDFTVEHITSESVLNVLIECAKQFGLKIGYTKNTETNKE